MYWAEQAVRGEIVTREISYEQFSKFASNLIDELEGKSKRHVSKDWDIMFHISSLAWLAKLDYGKLVSENDFDFEISNKYLSLLGYCGDITRFINHLRAMLANPLTPQQLYNAGNIVNYSYQNAADEDKPRIYESFKAIYIEACGEEYFNTLIDRMAERKMLFLNTKDRK